MKAEKKREDSRAAIVRALGPSVVGDILTTGALRRGETLPRRGRPPSGERAKHKKPLAYTHPYIEQRVLRSIRGKTLQNLVLLWFEVWDGDIVVDGKKVPRRTASTSKHEVALALTIADVQGILGCSKRTAREYIDALRYLTYQ